MRWQIMMDGVPTGDDFDDGIVEPSIDGHGPGPGDEGFTTDVIAAHCDGLGTGYGWNYAGVSWPPAVDG